jgi:hypothetical protein
VLHLEPPPVDPLNEWRCWHAEQEARFAAERGRNKSEERVEALIACALAAERSVVIPVIRQALDELLDAERERHKSELVSATRGLAIAKLETPWAHWPPSPARFSICRTR